MESENEPAWKEVHAVEEASNGAYTGLIEGAEVAINGGLLDIVDGSPDHSHKADSSSEAQAIPNILERKISKSLKKSDAAKAEGKVSKEKPLQKGVGVSSRNQKALISKSLSFPEKVATGGSTRKSTHVHPMKKAFKHDQDDGKKAAPTPSISQSNRPTKSASQGMNSKHSNANTVRSFARQTSLTQKRSNQQEVPIKPSEVDEATDCPPSEVIELANENLASPTVALSSKGDSTTPSDTPQVAGGLGFSSRLEERAEKRKEFFSKLEERIHAKEMEKTNLQARSKENQEAEIKQLRKSLTFKAAPMPKFYKEPPPKAELKKIPITRPVSPKLGRHKSSTASNNSEGAAAAPSPRSCHSPPLSQDSSKGTQQNSNRDTVPSKASVRKSYDKLMSQQNTSARTDRKLVKPKPKTVAAENHNSKLDIRRAAEGENGSVELPENEAGFDAASEDTPLDIMPDQVTLEG